MKKHRRFRVLRIELDENHVNPDTGQIELKFKFNPKTHENKVFLSHNNKEVISTKLIQGYFGENKIRTTSEIIKEKEDISIDLVRKLFRYDYIVAIDTNSKKINNEFVSIGCAHIIVFGVVGIELSAKIFPLKKSFILKDIYEKAENRNWKYLIEYLSKQKNYNSNLKIGLLVDSDLGNIDKFNFRELPIIENFYLPENFELIYAKDKPKENILNIAISKCHKLADLRLKELYGASN